MVGPHVLPGGWLKRDEMEVRHALVTYLRAEAVDHDFRATLIQNMAHHSEWKAVLER